MWIHSDKLDIAYVPVCKSACTSITGAILVASGVIDEVPNDSAAVHRLARYPMSVGLNLSIRDGRVLSQSDLEREFGIEDFQPDRFFTFVRHPLVRMVSCYNDKVVHNRPGLPPRLRKMPFKEFVRAVCDRSKCAPHMLNAHIRPQVHTLREWDYVLVGRVEDFDKDWPKLCKIVNFQMPLPFLNSVSRQIGWREYYDDESLAMACDLYREDFERFGYEIEENANV